MLTLLRSPKHARGLLILGICLLLLSSFPPLSTLAATKQQEINNALDDFKNGNFQRSSLSTLVRPPTQGDKLADKVGAVQLGPIGLLKTWARPQFRLPKKLYRMGAASFGNRIFLMGGFTPNTGSFGSSRVAEVWSTPISLVDGSPINSTWDAEPALPAVVGSNQTSPNFAAPTAPVASPAVTTVADSSGLNGYIYVIGGSSAFGTFDFSSYAVRIGTVTNGRITGWLEQTGARVPSPDPANPFGQLGVQSAVALSHQIGGTTYVYLLGGLQRYLSGGVAQSSGIKAVFYARVGAGGKLFKPSSPGTEGWDKFAADLPVPFSASGLWDASGTADNYVASSLATSADAIYLIGGQLTPNPSPTYSSIVYRATINSNGTLTWDWQGTMPTPRIGSSAIPFRGNLYVNGGQASTNSEPDKAVLTSYVEDDLTLHTFSNLSGGLGGEGTNFLTSDALPVPRSLHSSVLVPAGANSPNAGFLYVLGGLGSTSDADTSDDNGADTMIYGKIGGGEDISSTGYASDGWYYGQPFDVAQQFSQVQVQEVNWTTVVTRTTAEMDVAMDYRLSSSNSCTSATWGDWTQMTSSTDGHRSSNGQNSWPIANTTARCFQYRARLSTADTFATPALLNVSVKIVIPGSPDLSVKSISDRRGAGNAFTGLNVIIQNVNLAAPPTLAADVEGPGSFYVDMCIFGPGTAAAPPVATPPTLPLSPQNKQCSKVFANIDKSAIGANSTYPVTAWYDTGTEQLANIRDYFKTPGVYTVIVAVDSYVDDPTASPRGFVDEGDQGEGNNVSQPFTFTVQSTGYGIYLPQARR
jgi:hypothetical protein